ncbi:MAG: cytochrome-c oxidase, cbb3-type subunit III [Alphaproteobacteria bacterium]|nr:cytochrome-c oxidase, cbb3-type subunit III [Alphaproteobacteria bacterium]
MKKEIDQVTGTETTGHVWDDDLRELNKPLPRWWLYTLYATIIWAIGYWIAYPAWPLVNDYTKGVLGVSQRATVTQKIEDAKKAQSSSWALLESTPLDQVSGNPELLRFASASGKAAFGENCAPCHGRGAQGFTGYPNLNDDDWIWGGTIDDIQTTILYGIRTDHEDARSSEMPKFGADEILDRKQIGDVTEYVLSLSNLSTNAESSARGKELYAAQCVACHGENGKGNTELGAPNIADSIWLYGSKKEDIMQTVHTGRGGKMPAWESRLDPLTVKALAVYVHSLGGGK